jgi:glycosyltransferase involved in cell wall biosynthesis
MKVIIATRIYSPEPAAASFMLQSLAETFVEAGDDVEVVTSRAPKGRDSFDHSGYAVSRARVLRDSSGYLRGYLPYLSFDIPLFFRLLFRRRPDLYVIEPPPTSGVVVRLVSRLKRRPYFYDAADIWSDAAKMSTSSKIILSSVRHMELFALRGARMVFTISDGVAKRLGSLGIKKPVEVVGFGVDTHSFRYIKTSHTSPPFFVYAGTFSELHGAVVFLEAFSLITKKYPELKLIYVGNGTDKKRLEHEIKKLELSNVEVLESVGQSELNHILNNATASLASLKPDTGYEYAFTTKIYASLAAGCPVIFSGVGPTKNFLDQMPDSSRGGVAVAYDLEEVAKAMTKFLNSPLSDSQREDLSQLSRKSFSIDTVSKKIVRSIHKEMSR